MLPAAGLLLYGWAFDGMYLRSLIVWVIMIAAETVHGILRRLFLLPIAGEMRSNQIGVFVGSAIVLIIVWFFCDWIKADTFSARLKIGVLWCLLTFGFELGLGLVLGYSVRRIIDDYDFCRGGLMLIGMMILASSLMLVSKMKAK